MSDESKEITALLHEIELFKEFDTEALEQLASLLTEVRYKKGELVFAKGDTGNSLYIIIDGSVSIHNNGHTFATLDSMQYFGEYSLIDDNPRSTSVTATRSSRMLVLTRDKFLQLTVGHPELWQKMMLSLIERLRNFNSMEEQLTQTAINIQKDGEKLIAEKNELEKQRNELEQKNVAKDKFFTIISHDLKNPFSAIINITDLMLNDMYHSDPQKDHEYIKQINYYSHKIFDLLENLLQWARSQTGQIKISFKKVHLSYIFDNVIELQSGVAQQKSININMDVSPDLYAYADQNMTTFIFRNILSNALRFSPNCSTINIKACDLGDDIRIDVSDQGIGMDETQLATLFHIDSRSLTHDENNEIEGTGLGLILCKEFIEKNNGTISATSTKGKGSTFSFTIPKAL